MRDEACRFGGRDLPCADLKRPLPDADVREARPGDPAYPIWVTGAVDPELAGNGPGKVDPAKLELWRPPRGKLRHLRTGDWVYRRLKKAGLLERCLGLRELVEIKAHGVRYYRKHFSTQTVFGWRSVVRDRLGFLYVPYLFEFGDGVEVHWYLLEFAWKRTTTWVFPRRGKPTSRVTPRRTQGDPKAV